MSKNSDLNLISTSPSRVKNETKDKFDALLKQALNTKSRKNAHNQSTQKLISDVESLTSSNENLPGKSNLHPKKQTNPIEVVEVDVHEDFKKDNFLLNKFLNDSNQMRDDNDVSDSTKDNNEIISLDVNDPDVLFIKPPVPRPRKSKKVPLVNSPSASSTGTYKITSPLVTKGIEEESKTLNASKDAHSQESINTAKSGTSSIVKKESDESQLSRSKTFITKHAASQSSDSENEKAGLKSKPSPTEINDKISEKTDIESTSDQIKYENEIELKRKKKQLKKLTPRHQHTFKDVAETIIEDKAKIKYSYEKIIGITIHKTDRLKLDSLVIHPVVKIHIVDSETGKYLKKSDKNRPVVFYYENRDITYITPVISEAYNLYEKRSLNPAWEETLMINEDINFIVANENNTIIFFEIMDFVSFSVANSQFSQKGSSKGWHKIAWAFLKPLGKNNISNINKKARLQLYYPGKHKKVLPDICDIFHWWSCKKLLKYPASLYVSVKSIIPPEKVVETLRSKTPIHGEKASRATFGADTNLGLHQIIGTKSICSSKIDENSPTDDGNEMVWSRSTYQTCKLPNKCVAELPSHEEGCFMLKFSHNGLYLACAVLTEDVYLIIVFSVKSHEEIYKYSGHQGLIYDISWSKDDRLIVTASADCTVCVWSFINNNFVEMLPHPSYVYASEISSKNIIATGCYDQIVRIWCCKTGNEMSYDLLQELEGHKGYITSLCFNNKSTMLYSSDSIGAIVEWKYKAADNIWNLKREIKLTDLRDTIINQILLHTRERRLLIHARDSALRIIDLKTGCVLYWLQGALNNRMKTTCSFSSCGNFVFAGSENGFINVWNSDLGDCVASYAPYDAFNYQNLPVHCVQFHPHDNILAVSHHGHNLPILLIIYDAALDGKSNVGLKILQSDNEELALHKRTKSQPLSNLKSTVKKIIKEGGDGEKKQGKIKFEDVIEKIDQIVSVSRSLVSDSSRSSVNN